jgi:hypothetical protein
VWFPANANVAGNLAGTSIVFVRARQGIAAAIPALSANGKAAFFLDLLSAFLEGEKPSTRNALRRALLLFDNKARTRE